MLVSRLDGYSCADIAAVCEKMKARALERALEKAEHGKGEVEPVTRADADSVLQVYRNFGYAGEFAGVSSLFRRGNLMGEYLSWYTKIQTDLYTGNIVAASDTLKKLLNFLNMDYLSASDAEERKNIARQSVGYCLRCRR